MIYKIPLSSNTSFFALNIKLEGVSYNLEIHWNDRENHWYMTLADGNGTPIARQRKLVVNTALFARETSEQAFPGLLTLLDTSEVGIEAGLFDLGNRCILLYVNADSVGTYEE
jgi:hypothetical protein